MYNISTESSLLPYSLTLSLSLSLFCPPHSFPFLSPLFTSLRCVLDDDSMAGGKARRYSSSELRIIFAGGNRSSAGC